MKTKKNILFVVAIAVAMLSSCKKEKSHSSPTPLTPPTTTMVSVTLSVAFVDNTSNSKTINNLMVKILSNDLSVVDTTISITSYSTVSWAIGTGNWSEISTKPHQSISTEVPQGSTRKFQIINNGIVELQGTLYADHIGFGNDDVPPGSVLAGSCSGNDLDLDVVF